MSAADSQMRREPDRPGRALRHSYLVASVAGIVFFAMSVALLGLWPKRVLETQAAAMWPVKCSSIVRLGSRPSGSSNVLRRSK